MQSGIKQYKEGMISLGKMAEFLEISKKEAMHLLNRLGIDWLEYEKDDLDTQVESARNIARK